MNVESLDITLFKKKFKNIEITLFTYSLIVGFLLVLLIVTMCLLEKNLYYQNELLIIDNKEALLYVLPDDLEIIRNNSYLIINNEKYYYNIISVELISDNSIYYQIKLHIKSDLLINSFNQCKILIRKENLFSYVVRIIKGG